MPYSQSSTLDTPPARVVAADCTVVIPTYNECENIDPLITQILEQLRCRILVVDDGSPDGTGALVAKRAREDERIGLLSRAGKLGLGSA